MLLSSFFIQVWFSSVQFFGHLLCLNILEESLKMFSIKLGVQFQNPTLKRFGKMYGLLLSLVPAQVTSTRKCGHQKRSKYLKLKNRYSGWGSPWSNGNREVCSSNPAHSSFSKSTKATEWKTKSSGKVENNVRGSVG